jgi:glycosyltransferase involved in cell wall biosynthesis
VSEHSKVVVVMPAYNAAQTLISTYQDIPEGIVDEVILVDDASQDKTVEVASQLNLKVIVHPHNVGYGGNQKTCYMEALRDGADIVVMLHPDGQYDPQIIPDVVMALKESDADMILASRFLKEDGPLKGGMPKYKYVANRFLSALENIILGQHLSEFHTGYRAYSRRLLETVPFMRNSNDFVFDTEVIVQAVHFGFKIAEVPVATKYTTETSSVDFKGSLVYGLETLYVLFRYILHRLGIVKSRLFLA